MVWRASCGCVMRTHVRTRVVWRRRLLRGRLSWRCISGRRRRRRFLNARTWETAHVPKRYKLTSGFAGSVSGGAIGCPRTPLWQSGRKAQVIRLLFQYLVGTRLFTYVRQLQITIRSHLPVRVLHYVTNFG